MSWTALMPLKAAGARKSRLAGRLSAAERDRLTERMLAHVQGVLAEVRIIGRIVLLAEAPPPGWTARLIADEGRGLNAELAAARVMLGPGPLLVIHPDLPELTSEDVSALLSLAEEAGAASAPDHHATGTNAVAIADGRRWTFRFGPDSAARHRRAAPATIYRAGLAFDLDTEADLARLAAEVDAGTLTVLLRRREREPPTATLALRVPASRDQRLCLRRAKPLSISSFMAKQSAGILIYRRRGGIVEVLLVHPGGPFWRNRDEGAWQIPKGGIEAGETAAAAALRECAEELGVELEGVPRPLARIRQAGGKWVEAFALQHELDADAIVSAAFEIEWPPRSGMTQSFPEVDRAAWFGLAEARAKILPSQASLLDRFEALPI